MNEVYLNDEFNEEIRDALKKEIEELTEYLLTACNDKKHTVICVSLMQVVEFFHSSMAKGTEQGMKDSIEKFEFFATRVRHGLNEQMAEIIADSISS